MTEREIFVAALGIANPGDRDSYLDVACGSDAALCGRVHGLLKALNRAGDFMQTPPAVAPPVTEAPGSIIGPYKLLEQIGEGGMGLVFMAEQTEPIRRKVALKIIKPGMDTRQVVARFEAERQALAMMDHPNIARILDAGTTGVASDELCVASEMQGEPFSLATRHSSLATPSASSLATRHSSLATHSARPYFVMELVRGVPITEFCDQHRYTPKQRLALFVTVCQAVQHAHQKGIIHRDLKPSNILVTLHDTVAVPKIIDFGIAKALDQRLTERTLFTNFAQMIGTPVYMSPEQAEMNGLDADTRSDVYALGVLLYELLTGTTPFDSQKLKQVGFDEMRRLIREEDPPRPSQRVSTLEAAALTTLSERRGVDGRRFGQSLRGELDWIVMKCLEKDRNRRYETANGLAMDVQRYMKDEQVLACPPSTGYRLRKFARRNTTAVAAAGLVLSFLIVLGGGIGWVVGDRAARRAAIDSEVDSALTEVDKLKQQLRYPEAAAAARRAAGRSADGASAEIQRRAKQMRLDMEVLEQLEEVRLIEGSGREVDSFTFADTDRGYVRAFQEYGIDVDRLPLAEAVEEVRAREIREELAAALDDWARACWASRGENDSAWRVRLAIARGADSNLWRNRLRNVYEQWFSRAPAARALEELAASAPIDQLPPSTLAMFGLVLMDVGSTERAEALLLNAHRLYPGDFWINERLGMCYGKLSPRRPEEALRFFTAALVVRPRGSAVHNSIGVSLARMGRHDEAIAAYREAIRLKPTYANPRRNLGIALTAKGKEDEAIAEYREYTRLEPSRPDGHYTLSAALARLGRLDEAQVEAHKAHQLKPDGPRHHEDILNLTSAAYRQGMIAQARQLQEQQIAYLRAALQRDSKNADYRQWLKHNYWVLADNADLKHDELARIAEEFPLIYPDEQDECVRAAWYLTRCAKDVRKDDTLPAEQRTQLAEDYAAPAVDYLRRSMTKGNKNAVRLKIEPVFEPLRSREDFQKLLTEMEAKSP